MFNFGTMLGDPRGGSSVVTHLLAIPNVSLMRLLDEDAFCSDFRAGSHAVKE